MLVYVNLYSLTLIHTNTNKAVNEESLFEQFPLLAYSDSWIELFPACTGPWYKLAWPGLKKQKQTQTIIEITSYVLSMIKTIVICFTFAVWITEKFELINNDWGLCHAYSWPHQRKNDMLVTYFI